MKSKLFNGTIVITMPNGADAGYINVSLIDDTSRTQFCEVKIKHADFAQALVGNRYTHMQFEWRPEQVGKILEVKEEYVTVPDEFPPRYNEAWRGAVEELLKPYEVDGWKARDGDFGNHYRRSKGANDTWGYGVTFARYVNAPAEEIK
jgi:hypothetical protein